MILALDMIAVEGLGHILINYLNPWKHENRNLFRFGIFVIGISHHVSPPHKSGSEFYVFWQLLRNCNHVFGNPVIGTPVHPRTTRAHTLMHPPLHLGAVVTPGIACMYASVSTVVPTCGRVVRIVVYSLVTNVPPCIDVVRRSTIASPAQPHQPGLTSLSHHEDTNLLFMIMKTICAELARLP